MHDDTPATSPPPSRALVPAGTSRDRASPAPRPLAAFVAQLFACEARLEPFRSRRRAGPDRGAATYEAAGHGGSAAPARVKRVV
ncbi:MAG TPA: hypothetical protein VF744_11950 [Beijerinckiaceae bacterium]|jgi:hypothetical protein